MLLFLEERLNYYWLIIDLLIFHRQVLLHLRIMTRHINHGCRMKYYPLGTKMENGVNLITIVVVVIYGCSRIPYLFSGIKMEPIISCENKTNNIFFFFYYFRFTSAIFIMIGSHVMFFPHYKTFSPPFPLSLF